MTTDNKAMKAEAQETLDELFADNSIPFRLWVGVVEYVGMKEYIVRFHDSRLFSIDVSRQRGQTFNTVFRTAIVDRVKRLEVAPRLSKTA